MEGNTSNTSDLRARASELIATTRPLSEPHILVLATGEVLAANPAACRDLGIDPCPSDVSLLDLVTSRPETTESFLEAAARSTSLVPGALMIRLADGSERKFGCSGGLVQPFGGGQSAIILVRARPHEEVIPGFLLLNERIHDLNRALHERRVAQEALEARSDELLALTKDLERQKDEAQAANRAKSSFLSAMGHELRTPLSGIVGHVDLLDLGLEGGLTDPQRERLDRIRRSSEHLVSMIGEILEFSRLEAKEGPVHVEDVDLVTVATEAAEIIEPAFIDARLYLRRLLPSDPVMTRTDAVKVRQILLNLLSNAVKFTPRGSVQMMLAKSSSHASISVADTGIGIDPLDLGRIFEPFWQARRDEGGAGLGLAVTRHLATRLEGTIEVESVPGEGSTFTLVLPVSRTKKGALSSKISGRPDGSRYEP